MLLTLFGISCSGDALAKEEEVIVDSTSMGWRTVGGVSKTLGLGGGSRELVGVG